MRTSLETYALCEGREDRVQSEKLAEGRYRVVLGDRTFEVDAARAGASLSVIIDGRQSEVTVVADVPERDRSSYWVSTELGNHRVELLEPLAFLNMKRAGGSGRDRTGIKKADMPGRVVSLLAADGDPVERGQGVLVLEAMKMENEVASEADGVLTRFFVEPGAAVEAGDPLFEVSPPDH